MRVNLQGKIALVTGSAHRVGRAIALELARNGCSQIIHYNGSAEKAAQTVAEVRALGVEASPFQADMGKPDEIAALFAEVEARYGRLDILVNSAAIFDEGDLTTLSLVDWERSLNINLTAPFLCAQHAVRLMRKGGQGGAMVNISDMSGIRGDPHYPQHSVSKAALLMFSSVAARAFAPDIRVNTVVPGLVMKPPGYTDEQWTKLGQKMPLKRTGSGEDVARAVLYLLSEAFVTGTVLTVDAGEHLL